MRVNGFIAEISLSSSDRVPHFSLPSKICHSLLSMTSMSVRTRVSRRRDIMYATRQKCWHKMHGQSSFWDHRLHHWKAGQKCKAGSMTLLTFPFPESKRAQSGSWISQRFNLGNSIRFPPRSSRRLPTGSNVVSSLFFSSIVAELRVPFSVSSADAESSHPNHIFPTPCIRHHRG